jgi:hypothetical protein
MRETPNPHNAEKNRGKEERKKEILYLGKQSRMKIKDKHAFRAARHRTAWINLNLLAQTDGDMSEEVLGTLGGWIGVWGGGANSISESVMLCERRVVISDNFMGL